MNKRVWTLLLALVMGLSLAACGEKQTGPEGPQGSQSQETKWPAGAVQVVVPAKAGGDTDTTARYANIPLEKLLGQTFTVVNMEGSSGMLAINDVITSPADGSKMLYYHTDVITQTLLGNTDFSWQNDMVIAGIPFVSNDYSLFVAADAPFDDLQGMIAYASDPANDKLIFGGETNTIAQVLATAICSRMGIDFTFVEAGGNSTKIPELLAGRVDVITANYAGVADYVENGDFKCLGSMGAERCAFLKDVPTFQEQGVDITYEKFFFYGFLKGTPDSVVTTFTDALKQATADEEYISALENYNASPNYLDPKAATEYMAQFQKNLQEYFDIFLAAQGG